MKESTTLHQILYEKLLKRIEDQVYDDGAKLPSEHELCKEFGISRPTVRQALLRLENEGLILKHQGKGSIVRSQGNGIGILSIEGTTSSFESEHLSTIIVSKPTIMAWPEMFNFEIDEQEVRYGCVFFERVRIIKGKPILFEATYLTNNTIPDFSAIQLDNKSLFQTLRKIYSIKVLGGEQKISSISAEGRFSELLKVSSGTPLIKLDRKIRTNKSNLHIYSVLYCNTDLYYLKGEF